MGSNNALTKAEEITEANVATVEDMIAEHLQTIASEEADIERLQDAIKAKRASIKFHRAELAKKRQYRRIFETAALKMRQIRAS